MKEFDDSQVRTLPELLTASAEKMGDATALHYLGRNVSYHELASSVGYVGSHLRVTSRQDAKVAIWMPNIPQFVISYYGVLAAGRIAVPINYISIANELKSKPVSVIEPTTEIIDQLTDSRPSVIFIADIFYPIFKKIPVDWPCKVYVTGIHEYLPFFLRLLYPFKARREGRWVRVPRSVMRMKQIIGLGAAYPELNRDVECPAQLQYTGGTTGTPKGAELTHRNLASNVFQSFQALEDLLKPEAEVVLAALPLFHVYGLTACMNITLLALRGELVLMPAFDPKKAIGLMAKRRVTLFPGVNRMYQALVAQKKLLSETDLSALRLCLSGAGPVDKEVIDAFARLTGAVVCEGYGLSETSPVLSVARPEDMAAKKRPGVNLLGRPVSGTLMKTIDEDGNELPVGENGEIAAKGPQVMKGYHNKPEETAAVFKDGWFLTGDVGYRDEDGCFILTDRKKDMIKVLGENIYASHIEQALKSHPAVTEAHVVGVPDTKRGETPIACITVDMDKVPEPADPAYEVLLFMRNNPKVTPYQVPSRVLLFKTFDEYKNPIGKLLKRLLKQEVLKRI